MSDTWHARPASRGALFKVGSKARTRALCRHNRNTEVRWYATSVKGAHRAAVRDYLHAIVRGVKEPDAQEPDHPGDLAGYT